MLYWMLVPILLFLSGCAEAPLPKFMTPQASSSIQIGRSTMTDVQAAFGLPQIVRTVVEKDSAVMSWWYQYVEWPAENRTIVKVEFGPNQVVQKLIRIYEERRSPEARGIPVPLY